MLLKSIFPIFFLVTAIADEEYRTINCPDGQNSPEKLKDPSMQMPRPIPGMPLIVKISAEVLAVSLDEEKQEFEATFFFRQEWNDPRMRFESEDKNRFRLITDPESIWKPDLFFVNDIYSETENYEPNNVTIKNFPNGRLFTVERKTVKAPCLINLLIYPFDKQTCQLQVESYGHTLHEIMVQWNGTKDDPGLTGKIVSENYLTSIASGFSVTTLRGAKYSSPRMIFSLSRTRTTVIARVILPIVVITLCSWISFLFCEAEIKTRIVLCISPILTYILQINFCTAFFISPFYLTSLDVWAATALVAMVISGVECIYVVCKKGNQVNSIRRAFQNPDFKYRIILAIFVAALDILSIICVFLTRPN